MLKSLRLENFQSHECTELYFTEGVNIIIGPSDSGKSAILRAMRWLIWNRPSGEEFRSYWGGETKVILTTDKHTITRTKSDSTNTYELDGTTFKAFGQKVPDEITAAIGINDINLQQQLDRPFLLDDSPGVVAEHFNRIVQLDIIDKGRQNIQRAFSALEQKIEADENNLIEYTKKLNDLQFLNELEPQVITVEALEAEIVETDKSITNLRKLTAQLEDTQNQRASFAALLALSIPLDDIMQEFSTIQQDASKIKHLSICIAQMRDIQQERIKYKKLITLSVMVDDIQTALSVYKTEEQKYAAFYTLVSSIKEVKYDLVQAEIAVGDIMQAFDAAMPDICPLCGQEVR